MRQIFPYPLLWLSIVLMWLMLNGFTLGQLIIGSLVSMGASQVMRLLKPEKIKIKSWRAIFYLGFMVIIDITASNLAVAWLIITGGRKDHVSGFIIVPLKLESRTALAVLSCVMTGTPGTAWVAYNNKNNELLVHVLDLHDEAHWQDLIKNRYEKTLLEIFG